MFEIFNQEQDKEPAKAPPQPTKLCSVSIGGSVLIEEKPNAAKIAKFAASINKLSGEGYKFVLVLGGGKVCRNYQATAKSMGGSNYFLDEIGIMVSRLNATLLTNVIDNAFPTVLTSIPDAMAVLGQGKTPILGGLLPGITTDAVAALAAEAMQGSFINLSNVDGVYSSDPRKSSHAKFYPELSYDRLISIIQLAEAKPGQNIVLDLTAALILKRSKIRAVFLNGADLENFEAAVRGGEFKGTVVSEETMEGGAGATGKRAPRGETSRGDDYSPPKPDEIDF
jgi:uridylate kinase